MSTKQISSVREFFSHPAVPVVSLDAPSLDRAGVQLWIQQEYLLHPEVSGNKWRKLKYNLLEAARQSVTQLVTVGGAYSNHLAAVAAAGAALGFSTLGYVRGERAIQLNPTLQYCVAQGMELRYLDRPTFRAARTDPRPLLAGLTGTPYYLPEGGTNALAVRGCAEMWEALPATLRPDVAAICAGTGGTAAGWISGAPAATRVEVYPALKGDWMKAEIQKWLPAAPAAPWYCLPDYHFGGYARTTPVLLEFIRNFRQQFGLPLDPVYTGKLFYGLMDRIDKGIYPRGTTILAAHTGGLQGIRGFEERTGERL